MHDDDIHHFTDRLGRTIDIAGDSPGVVARHKGKQVGSFVIKEFDDDVGTPAFLEVVEVDPAYQNTGIGTAMLRLAHEYYGVMEVPDVNVEISGNPITTDGWRLIKVGVRNRWLIDPWEKPDNED